MMKYRSCLAAAFVLALAAAPVTAQGTFLGKPLAKWLAELNDKDPEVRRGAAFALGKFPDHAVRVSQPLLHRIADDNEAGVRDAAATALGDVTQRNELAVLGNWSAAKPVLQQALVKETDERALRGVLYAIGCFGPGSADLRAEVQAKLEHKDASIRQNAAWALGRMGEKAVDALDALVARLPDEDALVRRDSATALGDIAVQATDKSEGDPKLKDGLSQKAARPLLAMVKNEIDDVVQKTALEKLIKLVRPAKEGETASPYKDEAAVLTPLLTNKDPELAHVAAFVLAKIGGKEAEPALPILCEALRDEEVDVQRTAAASLENLGPLAAPAVRDLSKALRNGTDKEARAQCANALAHIGVEAKPAILDLVAVAHSAAPIKVRHFAAEALVKILEALARKQQLFDNQQAVTELLQVLAQHESEDGPASPDDRYSVATLRQKCVTCFFFVPELSKNAISVLSNVLDEKDDAGLMVRYEAARVLAEQLHEQAPNKAVDWLLHFLRNDQVNIYFGTRAEVSGGGTEASTGSPMLKANFGGDARFIAANALGKLGKKAAERKDVIDELRKAAGAKDPRLREEAKKALDALGAK